MIQVSAIAYSVNMNYPKETIGLILLDLVGVYACLFLLLVSNIPKTNKKVKKK